MPRKPRYFLPNIPVHVVIRGNSRRVVFAEDADRKAYLAWLKEEIKGCAAEQGR